DFQSAISLRLRLTQTSSSTNSRAETNLKSPLKSLDRRSAARALGEETMGRVYDALKRAESAPRHFTSSKSSVRRNGNPDNVSYFVPKNGHEHPWEGSPFTGMPAAIDSASTAHTAEATGGPALPGGPASRDAGATLGAVGSARAAEFSSREV